MCVLGRWLNLVVEFDDEDEEFDDEGEQVDDEDIIFIVF